MLGVWIALIPVLMLFLGLVSAYLVRQGLGGDWVPVKIPSLLWGNTAILLASSGTLEISRRRMGRGEATEGWLWTSFLLAGLFLLGQLLAWRELLATGIRPALTPHASFFYVLTGTHAVHLLGGIVALLGVALWPAAREWMQISRLTALRAAAVYWHFLAALWVGLFLLIVLWT